MSLKVWVPSHEDFVDDETKQQYTIYTVKVQKQIDKGKKVVTWELKKRFSAFADLYAATKDKYEKRLGNYQFPNKSMFNTFSQFTKDRRQMGFNELLLILIKVDPLPMLLEDFLEIDDNIHLYDSNSPSGYGKPNFLSKKSKSKNIVVETVLERPKIPQVIDGKKNDENKIKANAAKGEGNILTKAMNYFKKLQIVFFLGSLAIVTALYSGCVYICFIDISKTTNCK